MFGRMLAVALSATLAFVLALVPTQTIRADDPTPVNVGGVGTGGTADKKKVSTDPQTGDPVDTDQNGELDTESAGVPVGATRIEVKTSSPHGTHSGGEVNPVIRNTSKTDATDCHVYVEHDHHSHLPPIRVGSISTTGSNDQTEDVDVPGNGGSTGVRIPSNEDGTITNPLNKDETNKTEADVTLNITIEVWDTDANPPAWKLYTGKPVRLFVWWTQGINRNKWIQVALPNGLGAGDDRVLLSELVDSYDPLPLEITPEQIDPLLLNDIALGEADNHRFQDGSFVIKGEQGTRFEITDATTIKVYTEEGQNITGRRALSTSNLRIDADGNFAFDIRRNQDDPMHVAVVISGLQLARFPTVMAPGQKITAGIGGAVLSGRCFQNVWTLAVVE